MNERLRRESSERMPTMTDDHELTREAPEITIRNNISEGWRRLWCVVRAIARTMTPLEWFGLSLTALFILLMFIGPAVAPHPTRASNPDQSLMPPSLTHPFGTDENGMDILSRIIAAPRVDVAVGLTTALLAVMIGIPLGVVAGFFEGSERRAMSLLGQFILRLLDVIQAFPVFILAMVLVAVKGAAIENILFAITFVNVPLFLRLSRSEMLLLRERLFSEAARAAGNSDLRIAFRHLLPNAMGPLMNQISVTVGFAILLTAGLSFVGAGVAPPTPELGAMVSTGAKYTLLGYWWVGLFPGVFLGLVVFVFAVTGELLDRLLQPGAIRVDRVEDSGSEPVSALSGRLTVEVAGPQVPYHVEDLPILLADAGEKRLLDVQDLVVIHRDAQGNERQLLRGISLQVADGETVGIVGESGSGKSILVRSLLMLPPEGVFVTAGSVHLLGQDLTQLSARQLRGLRGTEIAALLPGAREQLNPVITVGEMMTAALRAHTKMSRSEARARAAEALAAVSIPDPVRRLDSYPHELSGGMAQRVCIALSLLHEPRLIIADEPTSGLDVTVTRQVLDLMAKLSREHGMSQLLVTRDLGIVAQYCDRIAVMREGHIVEFGPVAEVFAHPRNSYTRRLIDAESTVGHASDIEV